METEKTYVGEFNKNDGDIGLCHLKKISTIKGASYKHIIIIKNENIKRTIYEFDAENM